MRVGRRASQSALRGSDNPRKIAFGATCFDEIRLYAGGFCEDWAISKVPDSRIDRQELVQCAYLVQFSTVRILVQCAY